MFDSNILVTKFGPGFWSRVLGVGPGFYPLPKALTNVYHCFFGDKNAYFHDIFSLMAGTRNGNFGSVTMFLTPVFSLIMHKILINIHAFDI